MGDYLTNILVVFPEGRSSNVYAGRYDRTKLLLFIQYMRGDLYAYHGIPEDKAKDFFTADSLGTWVWDHLRVRGSSTEHQVEFEKV